MHLATQEFINDLEAHELKYNYKGETESGKDRLVVSFGGENMSDIVMQFIFSADNEDVALRIFDIVKVPEPKINKMIKVVNDLNNKYRFAKFCLDTDDNTIQLEIDTPFREGSIGLVCREIMLRALNICDDAYPELMKSLWT